MGSPQPAPKPTVPLHSSRLVRTALMLAQWFPPCQAWPTAAARARLLAGHLPEHGWQTIVLAPDMTGGACKCGWCADRKRCEPLHAPGSSVHRLRVRPSMLRRAASARARAPRSGRETAVPTAGAGASGHGHPSPSEVMWLLGDTHSDWPRVAVTHANRLLGGGTVDAIWTTSAPFAHIKIGDRLARQHELPWVADLRDPVSTDVTAPSGWLEAAVGLRRKMYRRPLLNASAITAATGQVVLSDGPWLGREPVLLVPGFDDQDWTAARAEAEPDVQRFEVVFTGKLYETYRRPDVFLRGLRLAAERLEAKDRERLRFVYYGRSGKFLRGLAVDLGCSDLVEDRGFLDPAAIPSRSSSASALLLLTNDVGDSGVPGGKFFEYLGAHRPVLAVPGKDQYVASVLSRTNAGQGADDEHQVADILVRWFSVWRRNGALPFEGDLEEIEKFSARASAGRLAALLSAAGAGV